MPKAKERSYEELLGSLEIIVNQLESGDLPLERALEIFEEGIGLARRCQTQLEIAERKVEVLLRERGEIKVLPFDQKVETLSVEGEKVPASPSFTAAPAQPAEQAYPSEISDDIIPF